VLNSVAAGWRLALRAVACQAAATLVAAGIYAFRDPHASVAVLVGGGGMMLGSLVASWGAFGGGVVGAGHALGRLLLGTAGKWLVVAGGLYLAMAVWRLPALPVLVGAAMGAAGFLLSLKWMVRRSTTRMSA